MASSYSYGGVAYRVNATSISFALPYRAPAGTMVHLLLENMGRINFSHGMDTETKGVGEVTLNGALWKRWTSRCLAFDYASEIIHAPFAASSSTSAAALFQPTLFRGTFHADAIADTFVEMRGWSKGAVWINGFALGRYVEAPLSNDNDLASIASLQFPPSAASARASLQVPCFFLLKSCVLFKPCNCSKQLLNSHANSFPQRNTHSQVLADVVTPEDALRPGAQARQRHKHHRCA